MRETGGEEQKDKGDNRQEEKEGAKSVRERERERGVGREGEKEGVIEEARGREGERTDIPGTDKVVSCLITSA